MSETNYEFKGWKALDENSIKGQFEYGSYEPKKFDEEEDVDIKLRYCGVCASDLHTAGGGWGKPAGGYPQVGKCFSTLRIAPHLAHE